MASTRPLLDTLVEHCQSRAEEHPDRTVFGFGVSDDHREDQSISYRHLDLLAKSNAALLQRTCGLGDRVVLLHPPGLGFISGFFGCMYAGAVAVPAYPPHPARVAKDLSSLMAILRSSGAVAIHTTQAIKEALVGLLSEREIPTRHLSFVVEQEANSAPPSDWRAPETTGDDLAFLQYTSGSTGAPKGVMVSHSNLISNLETIRGAFHSPQQHVGVHWLPFYHDMGLIGGVLETAYSGATSYFLSPAAFIQRPFRWLQAISQRHATISGGPNFAYHECVRRITEEQKSQLDLSSWQFAFCGAEPIDVGTLNTFAASFRSCGFRREAFYPSYGLAEATLMVSVGALTESAVEMDSEADAEPTSKPSLPGAEDATAPPPKPIGCGRPVGDQTVIVVDPQTLIRWEEGETGEIWISGSNVAQGYWANEAETRRTFHATLSGQSNGHAIKYLRTGDLGFLSHGELFVTSRLKDVIIVDGKNHHPEDIEKTVRRCHQMLSTGGCAAFSVMRKSREQLVVLAEVNRMFRRQVKQCTSSECSDRYERSASSAEDDIVRLIRRMISDLHGLQAREVVLVNEWSLPRTSSGKVRRHLCRQNFINGTLKQTT